MELLTPGEKVKKLRLELGLKQDDIANEKVSKSLISMIESNKRGLTLQTATTIAESLNKHYKIIGKEILPEYLMETEVETVKKQVEKEKEYLKHLIESDNINVNLFTRSYKKLMELVTEWKLKEEEIQLTLIRGDFYYNTYQYNNAIKDYSDALAYYIEQKNYGKVADAYNSIGACYYMLMLIDQALIYYLKAYDISTEHNISNKIEVQVHTIFNLAICYRKIKRFDMVLHYINLFREIEVEKENEVYKRNSEQLVIMEANTYRDLLNFEKAEKSYEKLLQKEDKINKDTLFLVYDNYVIHHMEQGDPQSAFKYIYKALELRNSIKENYLPWILITKAKCHMKLSQCDEALMAVEEAMYLSQKVSKNDQIVDCHFILAQIYMTMKDYEKALQYLKEVEEFINVNDIKVKKEELDLFYAEAYCAVGEVEKGLEYMSKLKKDYLALNKD